MNTQEHAKENELRTRMILAMLKLDMPRIVVVGAVAKVLDDHDLAGACSAAATAADRLAGYATGLARGRSAVGEKITAPAASSARSWMRDNVLAVAGDIADGSDEHASRYVEAVKAWIYIGDALLAGRGMGPTILDAPMGVKP